jgi:hypothetical protein
MSETPFTDDFTSLVNDLRSSQHISAQPLQYGHSQWGAPWSSYAPPQDLPPVASSSTVQLPSPHLPLLPNQYAQFYPTVPYTTYTPVSWGFGNAPPVSLPLVHTAVQDTPQASGSGSGQAESETLAPRHRKARGRKILEGGVRMHALFATSTSTD